MANDISANPWRLDTSGAGVIYAFPVRIGGITWTNYTPGTALAAVLQDINGKDIFNAAIPAAQSQMQPITTGVIGWVRGVKLTTFSGTGPGELVITVGAGK